MIKIINKSGPEFRHLAPKIGVDEGNNKFRHDAHTSCLREVILLSIKCSDRLNALAKSV